MSVQKLTQFATKVMTKAKALPMPVKIGFLGAVGGVFGLAFGAGMLAEKAIIGDKFERTNTELMTQTEDAGSQVTEPAKSAFEYVSPKIDGEKIASVKEEKYPGTEVVSRREYKDKDGKTVYTETFNKDGTLKSYTIYSGTEKLGYDLLDEYNASGELIRYQRESVYENGAVDVGYLQGNGDWDIRTTDDKDRYVRHTFSLGNDEDKDWYEINYSHNSDGSYKCTTLVHPAGKVAYTEVAYYDKNDNLLKEKRLDYMDVLQYTVTPKYDSDGDIIKNDTVFNK